MAGQSFCGISLDLGVPDVSSWLDLGFEFLAGIPHSGCCDLLVVSHQEAHGVGLFRYWGY